MEPGACDGRVKRAHSSRTRPRSLLQAALRPCRQTLQSRCCLPCCCLLYVTIAQLHDGRASEQPADQVGCLPTSSRFTTQASLPSRCAIYPQLYLLTALQSNEGLSIRSWEAARTNLGTASPLSLHTSMSVVNITDIQVLSNPGRFTDPYVFKITFECISELTEGKARSRKAPSHPWICLRT